MTDTILPWPSTPEAIEELKQMLSLAKDTADSFHQQAQIDLDTLHKPILEIIKSDVIRN